MSYLPGQSLRKHPCIHPLAETFRLPIVSLDLCTLNQARGSSIAPLHFTRGGIQPFRTNSRPSYNTPHCSQGPGTALNPDRTSSHRTTQSTAQHNTAGLKPHACTCMHACLPAAGETWQHRGEGVPRGALAQGGRWTQEGVPCRTGSYRVPSQCNIEGQDNNLLVAMKYEVWARSLLAVTATGRNKERNKMTWECHLLKEKKHCQ